jgi:hypothetical protein
MASESNNAGGKGGRRGRPRSTVTETEHARRDLDITIESNQANWLGLTRRHELNIGYENRALDALDSDGTDTHDRSNELADRGLCGRAVLAELGRHGSPQDINASLDALLAAVKDGAVRSQGEAVRWLRQRRLGDRPFEAAADARHDLEAQLDTVIEHYRQRYPAVTFDEIIAALHNEIDYLQRLKAYYDQQK